jgi:thioredoxin-related protein
MVFFTEYVFKFFHASDSEHILVWKLLGLFVGLFGLGYLLAAANHYVHWPVILMGFTFNLSVTVGFIYYLFTAHLSWSISWIVLINSTIWIIPLWRLLNGAFNFNIIDIDLIYPRIGIENKMKESYTNKGESLYEINENHKTILIFIRHFGCTFCRKALDEIRKHRQSLTQLGYRIVIVHSADDNTAEKYFHQFDLHDIDYISDTQSELYREFGINRGTLLQLFGIRTLLSTLRYVFRYGVGPQLGDGFRLSGVVIINKGKLLYTQKHRSVSEDINWDAIYNCKTC